MRLVLVCISYTALAAIPDIESSFKEFIVKYEKVYKSPKEYDIAKEAFAESMREVMQLRSRSDIEHEVDINEFSDMPQDVFNEVMKYLEDGDNSGDSASSIDWDKAGALGPVRNQATFLNNCGSCYAIGSAAVMESRFKIQTGISKVVPFSVQQIVDCSKSYRNDGCTSGEPAFSYMYAQYEGMVRESSYPYKAKEGTCKTSITTDPAKQCLRKKDIDRVFTVTQLSEAKMMKALASGPVTASLYGSSKALQKYKSGIIKERELSDAN
ncbi:hypothetical protein FOL47_000351 [Perkinsus chesapeaki]|uniref:Uncharacterized protein n=1 Tax=Perkinsus chesapeaki TaxID=330153 RepID=A0A7J6MMZ3_PERCH|nr:hypothetical protein FOL47_000351 [Perkinsus chesapeaki]